MKQLMYPIVPNTPSPLLKQGEGGGRSGVTPICVEVDSMRVCATLSPFTSLQLPILHPSCRRVCGGGQRFRVYHVQRPNLAVFCHNYPLYSHPCQQPRTPLRLQYLQHGSQINRRTFAAVFAEEVSDFISGCIDLVDVTFPFRFGMI